MANGSWIEVTSEADGFTFPVWRETARGRRKGGLVLIQEIFGVTRDIKRLAADFSAAGYEVLAPALFERQSPRFIASHRTKEGIAMARAAAEASSWDEVLGDVQACITRLAAARAPVFMTGFCFGGSVTWRAASRCDGLAAASGYYGRLVPDFIDEHPSCPTILHFGRNDPHIPMEGVERVIAAHPDVMVHVYEAGHGFASNRASDFDAEASALAKARTLDLFDSNR
jgi:carboxymethylenebutenolidase